MSRLIGLEWLVLQVIDEGWHGLRFIWLALQGLGCEVQKSYAKQDAKSHAWDHARIRASLALGGTATIKE